MRFQRTLSREWAREHRDICRGTASDRAEVCLKNILQMISEAVHSAVVRLDETHMVRVVRHMVHSVAEDHPVQVVHKYSRVGVLLDLLLSLQLQQLEQVIDT